MPHHIENRLEIFVFRDEVVTVGARKVVGKMCSISLPTETEPPVEPLTRTRPGEDRHPCPMPRLRIR